MGKREREEKRYKYINMYIHVNIHFSHSPYISDLTKPQYHAVMAGGGRGKGGVVFLTSLISVQK